MARFLRPTTKVLTLDTGETVTVHSWLSHGDVADARARMYRETPKGETQLDPSKVSDVLLAAWLVDWTLTDERGEVVPIYGLTLDERIDVVRNLPEQYWRELKALIDLHDVESESALDAQKKTSARRSELTSA